MLAAFNVTALSDFGYNETTRFIDPMEQRYRAVDFSDSDYSTRSGPFSDSKIKDKLRFFIDLDAYNKVEDVEKALAAYWSTHTPGAAGPATKGATAVPPTAASGVSTKSEDRSSAVTATATGKVGVSSPAPTTLKTSTTSDDKKGKSTTTTKK